MAEYEDPMQDGEYEESGYQREAPEVYRRRRIIAVILALLVIILVVWAVVFAIGKVAASLGGGGASSSSSSATDNFASFSARPTSSASASGSASASASASPSGSPSGSNQPSASGSASPSDTASPSPSESSAEAAPAPKPSEPAKVEACGSNIQVQAAVDKKTFGPGENPVMTATVKNTAQNPCTMDLSSAKVTYDITSGPADVYSTNNCGPATAPKEATIQPGASETTSQSWDRTINSVGCGAASQSVQPGYYWLTVSVNGVPSERQPIVIQ
ncbi:hypothetical protein [Kocuria massiliensis]|uniref:hypothetical protein n=1 Tax=Kocuria massiliensis TaxID=1926282 RepID=UPI00117A3C93|nr:hypothetical protein [Kocuria massiliensis]